MDKLKSSMSQIFFEKLPFETSRVHKCAAQRSKTIHAINATLLDRYRKQFGKPDAKRVPWKIVRAINWPVTTPPSEGRNWSREDMETIEARLPFISLELLDASENFDLSVSKENDQKPKSKEPIRNVKIVPKTHDFTPMQRWCFLQIHSIQLKLKLILLTKLDQA